ncbi:carboxylating nicotinate-nucleotide diphosphorylase [Desulfurobacterium atlanticum]|uniref:Probable nicotinate-nucleotide pyrophosphorylase [carboxylating] n=1 Tax=Desulfurobacterium atlanticum TaxID=240169 RepID=A0A238XS69_9BACT|nr:carboxylating nicotinate-nucleotide diphosphorylase [Desulfurobacterium atlanticum]SNR61164.1 nicotinate-nucleotide pyrophosphorylase [carboxylating] [Desulfurobacterium atlanticum]
MNFSKLAMDDYILSFLKEDLGYTGDISSSGLNGKIITVYVEAKEEFILAGAPFFERVFKLLDEAISFRWFKKDGDEIAKGDVLCEIEGDERVLFSGERTGLNLLQHLSGIATNTRKFVKVLEGTKIKLLDTRKTTPGLRYFEKYATRVGGAFNHRMGLYDAVMIKDNHIKAYGGIVNAVKILKEKIPVTTMVEVEVENWQQLEDVLKVIEYVNIVMLDNWDLKEIDKAVKILRSASFDVKIEISGGITLETLKLLRNKDIDFISTSKLITAARWVDIGMEVK